MRTLKWILAALFAALTARAYVLNYDDSKVYVSKWQTSPISLQVKLSRTQNLSDGSSQTSCVLSAMDIWNAVLGTQQLAGTWTSGTTATQSNGINEIVMAAQVQGQDFGSGVLAVTLISTRGDSFAETDLLFNTAYQWDSYRGALRTKEDMRRVAIHELGHVLGLDHPDESGQYVTAIMNSHVSNIDTLTADDIAGGQALYGAPGVHPANDNFANATALVTAGTSIQVTGSNIGATDEAGEPNHAQLSGTHSVWWKWTAPYDAAVTVTTLGSNFDTVLGIYTGAAVSALTEVGSNDDEETPDQNSSSSRKRTSKVVFNATGGMTYYVAVDGWGSADSLPTGYTGSIQLQLSFLVLAKITSQPVDQSVSTGDVATFTVTATGPSDLSYQWKHGSTVLTDGGTVSGATKATLELDNVQPADAGDYTVTVTSAGGSTTSAVAKLVVNAPPVITSRPASKLVTEGDAVSLAVTVDGSSPLTYQWRHNRRNIPGATGPTLSIAAVTNADRGYYDVAVTNAGGGVARSVCYLSVAIANATITTWGNLAPAPVVSGAIADIEPSVSSTMFALKGDGTVATWRKDTTYELGVPTGLANVVQISTGVGNIHAIALRADGTVVSWSSPNVPFTVQGQVSGAVAVAAGAYYDMALKADGTVVAWPVTTATGDKMTPPGNVRNVVAIAAGADRAYALRADGTVVSWGGYTNYNPPAGLADVTMVATDSYDGGYALRADGTVVSWLGSNSGIPMPADLANVTSISGGFFFCMALKTDGTLAVWGEDAVKPPAGLGQVLALPQKGANMVLCRTVVPTVTVQPASLAVTSGDYAAMTVSVTGSMPVTYQWRRNGVKLAEGAPYAGTTTATLQILDAEPDIAGSYDVVVTNQGGSVSSGAATLTVNVPPAFVSRPMSCLGQIGKALTIDGTATDAGAVTYQWKHNNRPMAGATGATLTLNPVGWADGGYYEVVASNGVASNSSVFTLTVANAPATDSTAVEWNASQQTPNVTPLDVNHVVSMAASSQGVAVLSDGTVRTWGIYASAPPPGLNGIVSAATGGQYVVGLRADGNLASWGTGNAIPTPPPVDLRHVVMVSTRNFYNNVALKSDGTIVTWGNGGVAAWGGYPVPTNYRDVTMVGAGADFGLVLKSDGTVAGWGNNYSGQINIPAGLTGVTAISAGDRHSLALKSDGTVVAWGLNYSGQCNVPPGLTDVVAISAGYDHSVALKRDGSAIMWGHVAPGAATTQPASAHVQAIAAGGLHSLLLVPVYPPTITAQPTGHHVTSGNPTSFAVGASGVALHYQWRKDGVVLVDGANVTGASTATLSLSSAQSADAGAYDVVVSNSEGAVTSEAAALTVDVPPAFTVRPLSRVVSAGQSFTLQAQAVDPAAVTYKWKHNGRDIPGQTGPTLTIPAAGFTDRGWYVVEAANGSASSSSVAYVNVAGVNSAGAKLVAWGVNDYGTTDVPTGLDGHIVGLAVSEYASFAVKDDGTVVAWGAYKGVLPAVLGPVVAISAAEDHYLALQADGTVVSFGTTYDAAATRLLRGVVGVAAGQWMNYALLEDGTVYRWPVDGSAGLVKLDAFTQVVQISADWTQALGLKLDGTVVEDDTGTDAANRAVPAGLNHVAAVSCGQAFNVALKTNGRVVAWGGGYSYETDDTAVPANLRNVVAISARFHHAVALKSDGTAVTWGQTLNGVYDVIPANLNAGLVTVAANDYNDAALSGGTTPILVFSGRPDDATATVGTTVTFDSGGATGPLSVAYRWQVSADGATTWQDLSDNGIYSGTTSDALKISGVGLAMSGSSYRCVAADSANQASSAVATLTVVNVSPYAGTYFGSIGTGTGRWALRVNADSSATFIAYVSERGSAILARTTVDRDGVININGTEILPKATGGQAKALSADESESSTGGVQAASVAASYALTAQIDAQGNVYGQSTGITLTFAGSMDARGGSAPAGSYMASALGLGGGAVYAIVGPSGQTEVVTAMPTAVDFLVGTLGTSGDLNGSTPGGVSLSLQVDAGASNLSGTLGLRGASTAIALAGLSDGVASTAHLVNISSRADGGTGNNVAIGGFVVGGSGNKRLLLRAVGPTLSTQGLGVAEVMADPVIELHDVLNGSKIIANIDNWGDNADPAAVTTTAANLGAGALAGADAKSAATVISVAPGVYSFLASGKNATSGIVLVEIYDADPNNTAAKLVNISSRAYCSTGNNVTIGGFVVSGNAPKRLLLRAVGPTLSTQGIGATEVLLDPTIEVHDALHNNAIVATNDNWGDNANPSDVTTTGARLGATPLAASDTKSAAMVITLQPGVYSFIASGKGGTSGIVLVEVYDAD